MKDSRQELFVLDNHLYVSPLIQGRPLALAWPLIPPRPLHSRLGPPPWGLYAPSWLETRMADSTSCSRPGILVLINEADWELEGEEAYEIQGGDNILFVSTLHGG